MLLSSGVKKILGGRLEVERAIAEHRPYDVDSTPRESEEGLLVGLSLAAFAIVEGSRRGAVLQARESGEVAGAQEPSVEPTRSVMVATDSPGVTRSRGHAGDTRESVGGLESAQVTSGVSEERRGEDGPEARHAEQDGGVRVVTEPFGDRRIEFGELGVEIGDHLGETRDELGANSLGGERGHLCVRGDQRTLSHRRTVAASTVLQPRAETELSHAAQSSGCLVGRQQRQRGLALGEVEGRLQSGKVLEQGGAKPVASACNAMAKPLYWDVTTDGESRPAATRTSELATTARLSLCGAPGRTGRAGLIDPGRARRVPWRAMRGSGVGVTSATVAEERARALAPLIEDADSSADSSKRSSSVPGLGANRLRGFGSFRGNPPTGWCRRGEAMILLGTGGWPEIRASLVSEGRRSESAGHLWLAGHSGVAGVRARRDSRAIEYRILDYIFV